MENIPVSEPSPRKPALCFFADKKEFLFGGIALLLGWVVCNCFLFYGLNLGFALFSGLTTLSTFIYLCFRGHKLRFYPVILLLLSLILSASFARSDDGFVKFVIFCFLIISTNLGLCLMAGQSRFSRAGLSTLLDVPRTIFLLGFGRLPAAFRGFFRGLRSSGASGKKSLSIILGLAIALPLVAILIPLLISADAAFDALLGQLPKFHAGQLLVSIFFGSVLSIFFYTRGTALHHNPHAQVTPRARRGISALTINTTLIVVGIIYVVYLISQLAYFSGGFLGILPAEYSLSEYARRGFFELAWLCAINLLIIALSVGLVAKKESAPLLTRLLCLFIGIVTLFLAASASAKMFLYIDAFGLTRLRVLTQVVIFFIGITTVLVCLWLFVPKLPYMKLVLVVALLIGALTAWADVDTVVARYNVTAYQSGKLETVDVYYLNELGEGAIPYIALLQDDGNPLIAQPAKDFLSNTYHVTAEDFRRWNYVNHIAADYVHIPADSAPLQ